MKNKTILKMIMAMLFIAFLPLITIELLIKKPNAIISQVRLNFQLMLFLVNLGRGK